MANRSGFAFNISGSAVGTAKPASRGGQRARVSRQSFDDRRGGTAPAKSSGAEFEPSWHLDLGGLWNESLNGEKPAGTESGSGAGVRPRSIYSRGNDVRSSSEALRYATAAYGQPARRNSSREGGSRASRSQQSKRGPVAAVPSTAQRPPQTAPVRTLVDSPYGDALARPGSRPGSRKPPRFMGAGLRGESLSVRSSWHGSSSSGGGGGGGGSARGDTPGSRVRAQAQAQRMAQAKAQREAQSKVITQRDSLLNDSDSVGSGGEADGTAQSTDELHERQRHIDSMSPTKIKPSEVPGSAGHRRSSTAARTPSAVEHFPVPARVNSDSDSDLEDQLGAELEVSEETFPKQPGGYAERDVGRPTTAHRADRPSTAGLLAARESAAESDRPRPWSGRSVPVPATLCLCLCLCLCLSLCLCLCLCVTVTVTVTVTFTVSVTVSVSLCVCYIYVPRSR